MDILFLILIIVLPIAASINVKSLLSKNIPMFKVQGESRLNRSQGEYLTATVYIT